METIIPDISTIEYLKKMKLEDIFPKSLDSDNKENKEETEPMEINEDIEDIHNIKLEKSIKWNITLSSESTINCICSYNNILLIACNNEIKLYDIANNFESNGTIKLSESDKNILCLACTEIDNILYVVIGGEFSSIHVVDILSIEELTGYQLIGHKNKVYQLEFYPKNNHILLSAGKDCTVRLWNFKRPELLCIFGGPYSFESDVLCIDWNQDGDYFVGSGVDCVVRIYQIDEIIQKSIDLSMKKNEKVKTLLKSLPYYSCTHIHDNLIDCIKYNKKFIISKSVDGIIKEWLPFKDTNGNDSFFLINIFVYNTKQLILGIKFSFFDEYIVVGNELGQIFLFDKNKTEMTEEVKEHPFFQNNFTQLISVDDKKNDILLKCNNYNPFYKIIFFGDNKGNVYIYNLIQDK